MRSNGEVICYASLPDMLERTQSSSLRHKLKSNRGTVSTGKSAQGLVNTSWRLWPGTPPVSCCKF